MQARSSLQDVSNCLSFFTIISVMPESVLIRVRPAPGLILMPGGSMPATSEGRFRCAADMGGSRPDFGDSGCRSAVCSEGGCKLAPGNGGSGLPLKGLTLVRGWLQSHAVTMQYPVIAHMHCAFSAIAEHFIAAPW